MVENQKIITGPGENGSSLTHNTNEVQEHKKFKHISTT